MRLLKLSEKVQQMVIDDMLSTGHARALIPIEDAELKEKVVHILEVELQDTKKAHIMQADGTYYKKPVKGRNVISSQVVFCREAKEDTKRGNADKMKFGYGMGSSRRFIPKTHEAD